MTTIRLFRKPFEPDVEVYEAPSIAGWLLDRYGARPSVNVYVFAGEPSMATNLTGNAKRLVANDASYYTVLEAPGAPLVPFLVNLAISMVISAVVNSIFAPDQTEANNRNRGDESPTNALSARENRVRIMERVEDIFGTVHAVPSLLMPTYRKFVANQEVEYGLYCVGRGYYAVSAIKDGDSLLENINGASARVYAPFTSPNSGAPQLTIGPPIVDPVLSVERGGSVDGIVLRALNQLMLQAGQKYTLYGAAVNPDTFWIGGHGDAPYPSGEDVIFQPENERKPNFAAIAEAGMTVTYDFGSVPRSVVATGGETGDVFSVDETTDTITAVNLGATPFAAIAIGEEITINMGTAYVDLVTTVIAKGGGGASITVAADLTTGGGWPGSITWTVPMSETRTISSVGNGYIKLTGPSTYDANFGGPVFNYTPVSITIDNVVSDWTDWMTLNVLTRTEVWTNVIARGGMFKDDGARSTATVAYEVQVEQLTSPGLVPTGVVETYSGSLSGSTGNTRGETLERVTGWTGPVRVRMRRTTPFDYAFDGFVNDEITWADLYAVSPVTKPHFGNKTIIHTVTRATPGSTNLNRRQLNCMASRLIPTYDGAAFSGAFDADGLHVSGAIYASSRIVDIIPAVTVDPYIGNRPIADLDMANLWAVQQQLDAWNVNVGQFNYAFDRDQISYEETLTAICDASFCRPYRQGNSIRFTVDRPQANSVALFNHRNKRPKAETITRRFTNDSEYDGIELTYNDPDTMSPETIRLPLGGGFTKLKRVQVVGIRNYVQAWLRANREYQRLLYERLTIETVVTIDARALLPNSRVDIVDNTAFRTWDGEVIGQNGLEITLSRNVEFVPAEAHSIILAQRDGTPMVIPVTAGSASNKVVLGAPPAEPLVDYPSPEEGMRTRFSLAADIARGAQTWLVQQIALEDDGYVRITAVNYAPEYWAMDEAAIPPRDSVIN